MVVLTENVGTPVGKQVKIRLWKRYIEWKNRITQGSTDVNTIGGLISWISPVFRPPGVG